MNKKLEEKIDSLKELSIEELCAKFDCKPEDICLGDYIARNTSDTVCPYKVILGFADFENSDVTSLGKLEIVYGRKLIDQGVVLTDIHHQAIYNGLNLRNSLITDLGNLQKVYGSFSVNKNITSLGNLNFLGSNLYLNLTNITSIDTDLKIDGTLNVEECKLQSFGKLISARYIIINSKILNDLGSLESCKHIMLNPNCSEKVKELIKNNFARTSTKLVRKTKENNEEL